MSSKMREEIAAAIDAARVGKRLTQQHRFALAFAASSWLRLEWQPGTLPPVGTVHIGESFQRLLYNGGKWERIGELGLVTTEPPRFYLEAHLLPAVPK